MADQGSVFSDAFTCAPPITHAASTASNIGLMLVRRSFIWLYRIAAILTLYGVLAGVFGYCFLMGFYAFDSSWVVPVIVSPSDDKSLDCMLKIVQTNTEAETLELNVQKLQLSLPEFRRHRLALMKLEPQLAAALGRERTHNLSTGQELVHLNEQKHDDNLKTASVMEQVKETESQIEKDLKAGLITKGDAAVAYTSLNQAKSTFTDGRIAEVVMKDTILQKNTTNTMIVDTLAKQADLISQVSQLAITIDATEDQIKTERDQIVSMRRAVETAQETPYYMAITQGRKVNFAFVPYDNRESVRIGSPVYDCYLNMVVCRPVGTVKRLFPGEEHTTHPLFRSDMRGFLAQIELTEPQSAESKTLMLNRKPLLF
ncbi:MAG: hypothetical protein JO108_03370 [Acidobacteriaceae bacterium]|nr:hypothetical protein [Acidobacteriaceae bacterium]